MKTTIAGMQFESCIMNASGPRCTTFDELVALGTAKISSDEMAKDRGIAVATERVFMQPGVYKI